MQKGPDIDSSCWHKDVCLILNLSSRRAQSEMTRESCRHKRNGYVACLCQVFHSSFNLLRLTHPYLLLVLKTEWGKGKKKISTWNLYIDKRSILYSFINLKEGKPDFSGISMRRSLQCLVVSPCIFLSFSHLLIARWIVNSRNLTAQSKCREFYDLSAGFIRAALPSLFFSWISNSRKRKYRATPVDASVRSKTAPSSGVRKSRTRSFDFLNSTWTTM